MTLGTTFDGCSPEVAELILNSNCGEMAQTMMAVIPPKSSSDAVFKRQRRNDGGFACRMGFMTTCPDATCEDSEGIDIPDDDDPCIEWARFSGCQACEYYRCRERQSQCGEDGYLLGYVGKYCDRFSTITEPRLSDAGARWMEDVRRCLVEELMPTQTRQTLAKPLSKSASILTCPLRKQVSLSFTDWSQSYTIDAFDIPFQQILATGHSRLGEWFGGGRSSP